ncbi:hypothetical protein S40285_04973 [Stachybotrys chlorohalonatus IBT 40285]|uniref:Carboxylic ester hydrolase n=2 Tax=Stachybotrys TaxID=74721 RepID=A0A084QRW3_STAC4|nr:hypothetical protein S7711_02495 [Stachybotrys chartarum IBT 7711]KFA48211.1 hypothetical protein S40293_07443 [Stachybotrys chartarum IBT 40293]KFA66698.1 hypothetical protein S40285_04973 [Stachybotrys chlorohalonata IBT 40285]KFA79767.1 hypothetical protein S40288_00697 [Stachybotrys chartarum IBT 40288]
MRVLALLSAAAGLSLGAELQHITSDFGPNPTNVSFYLYVPDSFFPGAPLLVYPHWCHGTAQNAFDWKPWRPLADELGFITIYPSSPWTADHCWDVSSPETLAHDAGGDSLGIASMVRWTLEQYALDADRVFVAGISSGGMMTNVLAAVYPELFAAAASFAGVPYSCYAAPEGNAVWSNECATGQITHTGAEWAALAHAAYPEYEGVRPKMQIQHGAVDDIINVVNYYEQVKLWTSVLGVPEEPTAVLPETPQPGWTKYEYGRRGLVESFLAANVTHDIPDQADEVLRFFELACRGESCFSRKTLESYGNCTRRWRH